MIHPAPVTLEGNGVRLEPMEPDHASALARAAADGALWNLRYTTVPAPGEEADYVARALAGQAVGTMLPWVVRELASGDIVGSTRYHDIIPVIDRVEIGFTFYAARVQRTHVNTACKRLLLGHAFETLGCTVVGLRTDLRNERSQAAIERLGARKDGVLRRFQPTRDGDPRDTVLYSITVEEWPGVRETLEARLNRR